MDSNAKHKTEKAKTHNRFSIYHSFYMSKHLLKSICTQIQYNPSNFYMAMLCRHH